MNLPPNTVEVAPGHKCDVCKKNDAKYYNITFYFHMCSVECFEKFEEGYKGEIEEIARKMLEPDELDKTDTIRKKR